jgi:hypothetical protein
MRQEVSMCIPSGCNEEDLEINFAVLYEKYGAVMKTGTCVTEEIVQQHQELRLGGWIFA